MTIEKFIDYAYPTMMAEKELKALHNCALDKRYEEARKHAVEAIKQLTEAHAALIIMEERS